MKKHLEKRKKQRASRNDKSEKVGRLEWLLLRSCDMVGVIKKEVSQMTKYYLKMDNIMKNMFVVALNDELQAQSEQDECLEETQALLKKVSEYDLAQKRLQITAGEQRQIRKALNRLRSKYLAAGRYSDGIDKVIIQVAKPNTSRHMFW